MASNKGFLEFVLEQLSGVEENTYRAMMGEYIIYYRGKIAAYVCDDRFLVKSVRAAVSRLQEASYEAPYEGAKEMLLVEELPEPKKKRKV